ncbi:hypothetical protein Hanom_Chr13g01189401 [Helianthus anomalus]
MARPVAKVLVVLSQIQKIFELTTPRVGLVRPRVGCQFCFFAVVFSSAQHLSSNTVRV